METFNRTHRFTTPADAAAFAKMAHRIIDAEVISYIGGECAHVNVFSWNRVALSNVSKTANRFPTLVS